MRLAVLSVAEGAQWEERWVRELDHSPAVQIVRRCVDLVDLLAVAGSGQGRAALVEASLRRLDGDAVDRLHAANVVPVAVVARGDEAAEGRMRALGIADLVPADAAAEVVASVLVEAVRVATDPDAAATAAARTERTFADPSTSMPLPPGEGDPVVADPERRRGTVVAVWGPTGAPGRTTVALGLGDEVARLGSGALVVDADVYGGTVAAALGLLDESPGLAAACRQAGGQRLDAATLASLCWQLGPMLRVLTGLPLASRWPELRPAAIESVLGTARSLAEVTVVDCGFCLETDEELSFDTLAPRRNGATLAVLDAADLIVVVGSADPIGMQRLVRGLAELREAEVAAPLWVVLNRVRPGVVPGDTAGELQAALERFAGRAPTALLPADPRAVDTALSQGRLLGEAAPNGALRGELVRLAAKLIGVPPPSGRGARRRVGARGVGRRR